MQLLLTPSRDALELHFHYDKQTVELLKSIVPSSDRAWNKQRNAWTISLTYAPVLLREFGDNISIDPTAINLVMDACTQAETSMLKLLATATELSPVAKQWIAKHEDYHAKTCR